MAYVYRYVDTKDNIVKYVGIIWSKNRTLKQRHMEHIKGDLWCDGSMTMEFIKVNTRSEAEAIESHLIALYETDKWFNKGKAKWDVNQYLPTKFDWEVFFKGNPNPATIYEIPPLYSYAYGNEIRITKRKTIRKDDNYLVIDRYPYRIVIGSMDAANGDTDYVSTIEEAKKIARLRQEMNLKEILEMDN